eukprot:symbB.v1.2.004786.t1/scaffold274.1/size244435/27
MILPFVFLKRACFHAMGAKPSTGELPGKEEGFGHHVHLVATEIIRVAGMSGYHTSVLVDEQEYFFDAIGILEAPAFFSHSLNEQAQSPDDVQPDVSENFALSRGDRGKMVVIPIGYSRHSGRDLVAALQQHFERGTYDVFYKNCNTFSDAALYFLTGTRMPACYNRIERFVTATKPVSVGLLNVIFKAMVEHNSGVTVEGDIYTPNPLSADFSVDSLIKQLEGDSESESGSDDSDGEDSDEEPSLAHRLSAAFSSAQLTGNAA